ncbi:DUF1450 domain-containing protein [Haladaptatus salinisoli]|uniref:DUF1450 domain-containing protein n=1 Tax=Haladaptatus salinisoli TaxID=2884876 RepID=UPI001D0A2CB5
MSCTIEYCVQNVSADVRSHLEACEFDVREEACLQRCGDCFDTEFLVVNGTLVEGDHDRLLVKVGGEENRT